MSQNSQVIQYMETHGQITPLDAKDELGVMRLSARVDDIINGRGVPAQKVLNCWVTVQNADGEDCRVKAYWIEKSPQVHYLLSQEGFMANAPCNAEGVISALFVRDIDRVNCLGCRAYIEERTAANMACAVQ